MAEIYGIKPKMFTKEWWPYYWMYYKWHTIAFLFIGMLIIISIVQCANKKAPDLGIVYCGEIYYEDAIWEDLEQAIATDISDLNGDDATHIKFTPLVFIDNEEYAERNYASSISHTGSFSNETNYLYIYDSEMVNANVFAEGVELAFHSTDIWLDAEMPEDKLIYGNDGKPYAVSLKNSKILDAVGIDSENLYVLIKYDTNSPYENEAAYKNAVITANNLIK